MEEVRKKFYTDLFAPRVDIPSTQIHATNQQFLSLSLCVDQRSAEHIKTDSINTELVRGMGTTFGRFSSSGSVET